MLKHTKNYLPEKHYESMATVETSYWWHLSRLNWAENIIRRYYRDPSSLRVLDYGCGTGGFLFLLSQRLGIRKCLGVDPSSRAIEFARTYDIPFMRASLGDPSFFQEVDLVLLMDVLEHIEDDQGFLRSLLSRLGNGTRVLLSVPAMPFLFSDWDKALGHHRRYTGKGLRDIIQNSGGSLLFESYGYSYLIPAMMVKRVWMKSRYSDQNCVFPSVPAALNKLLLLLNKVELFGNQYVRQPIGTSLFCLVERLEGKEIG